MFKEPAITKEEVETYILEEKKYGFDVTESEAMKFIKQRKRLENCAPASPKVDANPHRYLDAYGNARWSDTGKICDGRGGW